VENTDDKIKMEVIAELGLFEKVKNLGWKSLSAKETGRIGGLITKKKKLLQMENGQ
jgi:small acid-soluble spore protein F (minor alpha/beta-type SASP)